MALVDLRVGVPLVDLGVLRAVDQDFLLAVVPVDQEAGALEDLAGVQVGQAVVQEALEAVVQEALEVVAQEAREAEALEVQEALLVQEVLLVLLALEVLAALEALGALGDLVVPVEVFLLQLLMTAVELML